MGTYTPKLNLYKPAVNEVGWGSIVDVNWDTLDNTITSPATNLTLADTNSSGPQELAFNTPAGTVELFGVNEVMVDTNSGPTLQLGNSSGASQFQLLSGGQASIFSDVTGSNLTIDGANINLNAGVQVTAPTPTAGDNSTKVATTAFVSTAIAAATPVWSSLQNATANLTLANAGFTSTFNQTSAVAWTWANTTAATANVGVNSPSLVIAGAYYGAAGGSLAASGVDSYSFQDVVASATTQITGTGQITNIAESAGSVVTLTLASPGQTPVVGQTYVITGMGSGKGDWLNGYAVKLLTATSGTCTFNDPTSHGTLASTPTSGTPTMTQVSGLSTLNINHAGSPANATLGNAAPTGNTVAMPQTNILSVGTAGSVTGGLVLSSSVANGIALIPSSGTTLNLNAFSNGTIAGGGITLFGSSGLTMLGSGSAQLSLATGATFTLSPSSNVCTLSVNTNTAATSGQSQSSQLVLQGNYWNGASAADQWTIENSLANGTNGASTLIIAHSSGTSGAVSIQFPLVSKYNGETTAGVGVPYERGATNQKSETGADANVLTVTPAAAAGMYRITVVLSVSAATAATLGWTATWTDSNGSAQAPTNLAMIQSGVAAPALTFTAAAAGVYYGTAVIDVNNAGTNIVVKTTFAGTSIAYKASATIERLQ